MGSGQVGSGEDLWIEPINQCCVFPNRIPPTSHLPICPPAHLPICLLLYVHTPGITVWQNWHLPCFR